MVQLDVNYGAGTGGYVNLCRKEKQNKIIKL